MDGEKEGGGKQTEEDEEKKIKELCREAYAFMKGTDGKKKDVARAAALYQEAADLGDVSAKYKAGLCHERGIGVPQNYVRAAQQYRQAADRGCPSAMVKLGLLYVWKRVKVADARGRAAELFAQAAERGDAAGQYNLGVCYATGCGVRQSLRDAGAAFTRAALQGHAGALLTLAVIAARSHHPTHALTAAKLLKAAVATGDPRAILVYANMCLQSGLPGCAPPGSAPRDPDGAAEDLRHAGEALRSAAATDNVCALCNCGVAAAYGWGAPASPEAAANFWQRGAKHNDPLALYNLALCYAHGRGVAADMRQARSLWQRAALLGHAASADYLLASLDGSTDTADVALAAQVSHSIEEAISFGNVFQPFIH